jgi:hypothetical protein
MGLGIDNGSCLLARSHLQIPRVDDAQSEATAVTERFAQGITVAATENAVKKTTVSSIICVSTRLVSRYLS